MAWNSYPGSALVVDSVWNVNNAKSATSYAMQYELRRMGKYSGYMDGDFGVLSIKAWQRYLRDYGRGTGAYTGYIDGYMGPMAINAACQFLKGRGSDFTPTETSGFYIMNDLSENAKTFPDYHLTNAWQRFLNYRR